MLAEQRLLGAERAREAAEQAREAEKQVREAAERRVAELLADLERLKRER